MSNGNGTNGNGNGTQNQTANPKKFLFISNESLSGDLAWKLLREGHEVKAHIKSHAKNKEEADVYDGVLEKVPLWEEYRDWADVIVFDDVGFGALADRLRKRGKLVVGGSVYTDALENDREFGQAEMTRLGINTLPFKMFSDYDECIAFLRENPGRYVWKPSGNTPSALKGIFFIGAEEDGKDLIEVLESNKTLWGKRIKQFQVQKFVSGVEIGAGAFFNGKDFVMPASIGFEHKRLFPGEYGPMTGEMGTLHYFSSSSVLFDKTLAKFKDKLVESGYVGYIDINCIVNARGIYPLEFTCRFGYPYISIQMEGIQSPMGEFLLALARGVPYELKVKRGFQVGAVIAVPPFPYYDKDEVDIYRDLSILQRRPNMEGFHLGDVKFVDGNWRVAGTSGYVLVITGSGTTVAEARAQMHSRIGNINLQNMFYRTDIGTRWETDSDRLQAWGYLSG